MWYHDVAPGKVLGGLGVSDLILFSLTVGKLELVLSPVREFESRNRMYAIWESILLNF